MKRLLFTHVDQDGLASAVQGKILQNKLDFFNDIVMIDYGDEALINEMTYFQEPDEIYISDISPNLDFFKIALKETQKVIICDHHETFFNKWNEKNLSQYKNVEYFYNKDMCGAEIFYEYVFKKHLESSIYLDSYIELVGTYDLWKDSDPLWEDANDIQRSFVGMLDKKSKTPYDYFIKHQLWKYNISPNKFFLSLEEKKIVKRMKYYEELAYKKAEEFLENRIDYSGNKYIYVELRSKISKVANKLLKKYDDVKYVVVRNSFLNDGTYSLRSLDGFNVREIAEKWDCGGHATASGVVLKEVNDKDFREGKIHLM